MYPCSFHWILIVLNPDRGVVNVFDSLRKPQKEYQEIIDMFTRSYIYTFHQFKFPYIIDLFELKFVANNLIM